MSMMGGLDDCSLSGDPKLLTDAILKILMVEERIEEKLDVVLGWRSSVEAKSLFPPAHSQEVQVMFGNNTEASRGLHTFEIIERSSVEHSLESLVSERSELLRLGSKPSHSEALQIKHAMGALTPARLFDDEAREPGRILSDWEGGVRMRSTFQLVRDENVLGNRDEHFGRVFSLWQSLSETPTTSASRKCKLSDYIPIHPNSSFCLGWSVTTILVLLFELTYVPYVLAWDIDLGVVPICTVIFWSLDTGISSITGTYNAEGIKNPIRVSATAYAMSWFPLDISIVLLDWISVFAMGGSLGTKLLRFSKLARAWRIVSILRFSKLHQHFHRLLDKAPYSRTLRMILRVMYLCVTIFWLLHLVACFWFLMGKSGPTDTGKRWLDLLLQMTDGTKVDLLAQEPVFQYMICFHWCVATFTLGSMEVGYANSCERVFAVAFIVVSYLFGSVLISLLSAIFVDHQTASMETTVKLRMVDRFLAENEVNNMLALRVQKLCFERAKMKEKLAFSDTVALKNLPASLYKDLRYEIIGRFLRKHDLFNCWSTLDMTVVKEYCVHGLEMVFLKPGDELFKASNNSESAYFFSSGDLTYSRRDHDSALNVANVQTETWLSEAAWWAHWSHLGTCEATSPCKVAVASHKGVADHVHINRIIRAITFAYCQFFCKAIALAKPPTSELPDDICVPFTKFGEMLMHFPKRLRIIISSEAIKFSNLNHRSAAKLQKEIHDGKCDAYINVEGELERTVSVMCLMLQCDKGNVLYRVGEIVPTIVLNEDGEEQKRFNAVPELKLPGLKQERGELLADTLTRLVDKKLIILKDTFEHMSTVLEEEVAFSREFGVKTRYVRTKMICAMREELPAKLVARDNDSEEADIAPSVSMSLWVALHKEKGVNLMDALSSSQVSLYLIFEDRKPFIYAWLPQELVDALKQISQHRRDEILSHMLSRVNVDIIEQGPYREDGLV